MGGGGGGAGAASACVLEKGPGAKQAHGVCLLALAVSPSCCACWRLLYPPALCCRLQFDIGVLLKFGPIRLYIPVQATKVHFKVRDAAEPGLGFRLQAE